MYRRRILLTGVAIVGTLAGCGGDDGGNGDADQNGGTGGTDQSDGSGETGQTDESDSSDQNGDGTSELAGVETYAGEWSGTIGTESYSGVWQFESNFDEGQVEGWFEGDGEGDITGSVSGGAIDAQGGAAFGTVQWSGEFSADGQEISGTWELAEDLPGSGTWSGSVGELEDESGGGEETEEQTEEETLPEEDQASGDEPIERYPDAVMVFHQHATTNEGDMTEIHYNTESSVEAVAEWYKQEFGNPNQEKNQEGEIELLYMFSQNEFAKIVITEEEYTKISVEYLVQN